MRPTRTKHTDKWLNPPEKWDANKYGPCEGLPVLQGEGFMASYWTPTWKERLHILFGRRVRLVVSAFSHPPVYLDTEIV